MYKQVQHLTSLYTTLSDKEYENEIEQIKTYYTSKGYECRDISNCEIELSKDYIDFEEMNLHKFCYEHNHEVFIKFNNKEVKVYLNPDILMLMEDNFLHNLKEFKRSNKGLRIDFVESCDLTIK